MTTGPARLAVPSGTPPQPATYQDILDLPPGVTGQIIDGTLYTQSRPARRHLSSHNGLSAQITPGFHFGRGGPGGWVIYVEPEIHFDDDILVPDIAGWRRERLPDDDGDPFFITPPDWVCEVLSPSTAGFDRLKTSRVYAGAGIPWMWVVDPVEKSLEVWKLLRDRSDPGVGEVPMYSLHAGFIGEHVARAEPFEAIELQLDLLWLQ